MDSLIRSSSALRNLKCDAANPHAIMIEAENCPRRLLSRPQPGAMYLGSQGDARDAQKDIALGGVSAALLSLLQLVAEKLKH
jgi:uncharacterized membrane protein YjdF